MINPKKELFVWGPLDGRPHYVSYFMIAIAKHLPQIYKYKFPEIMLYFIKDKMTFICDYEDLRNVGKRYFTNWLIDELNLKKLETNYNSAIKNLQQYQSKLNQKYFNSLKDKALLLTYTKWEEIYLKFWTIGLVPELANWGGEQILKSALKDKNLSERDFLFVFEKLTAPERLSFYQQEELELLELKKYNRTRKFENLITEHAKKYFWIGNSYFEQKCLNEEYFRKQIQSVNNADQKIKEIENYPKRIIIGKKSVIQKYNLGKQIKKISQRLSYSIWLQDVRKKQIFIANYYIDLFLKEISKRKKVSFLDLKFCWPTEIKDLLRDKKKVSDFKISQRKKFALVHYNRDSLTYGSGNNAKELVMPFLTKNVDKTIKVIKGIVVSIGKRKIKGKVRLLLSPRHVSKLHNGEILVTTMTSPDFIIAMKKASAIITDEGGMTSHVAIISRELNIPCIVGTKIATKLLKDNDFVEVDAKQGIIRKI